MSILGSRTSARALIFAKYSPNQELFLPTCSKVDYNGGAGACGCTSCVFRVDRRRLLTLPPSTTSSSTERELISDDGDATAVETLTYLSRSGKRKSLQGASQLWNANFDKKLRR